MREQRNVHTALRQLGFVGLGPLDWIFQTDGITCAIPCEQTLTFDQAIHFLREGAFQGTLLKTTRLTYYRLSQDLASWCRSQLTKGVHARKQVL